LNVVDFLVLLQEEKTMKLNLMRIFSFALLLCLLFPVGLAGCGGTAPDPVIDETTVLPSDTDGTETPTPAEGDYRYVALIGVDGAGAFFRDADTPCIDEIFKEGAVTYTMLSEDPSISAQCWGSMLHGVTNDFHGVDNTIAETRQFDSKSKYPSIFRVVRENDPDAKLASFTHWSPINFGIIEDGLGVHKVDSDTDEDLTQKICEYVKDVTPNLLFVQFDEADASGHNSGFGGKEQQKTINRIDGYIGEIYRAYEDAGVLDETLFIVTADHGGVGHSHGGLEDSERNIMFAVSGHTVQKNSEIQDMEIRDTAAVVLHALGYDTLPATWTARVPGGLFEGVEATERIVMANKDYHRYHENAPTPAIDGGSFVTDLIPGHSLLTYLPFDGNVSDLALSEATGNGNIEFMEGFFGQGACLDNGYASLENVNIDKNSFTLSTWVYIKDEEQVFTFFSAKDQETGSSMVLNVRNGKLRFNITIDGNSMYNTLNLPVDYVNGWMPLIVIVDREAQEIRMCYDFDKVHSFAIPDALKDASFAVMNGLSIGKSGISIVTPSAPAVIDEFMILDGALTEAELETLARYYGKEPKLFDPIRDHQPVSTPAKGDSGYISNFISESKIVTYLPLDGTAEDFSNGRKVSSYGSVKYEDGFFGQGANLTGGYISLEDYNPGQDSLSVAVWVKISDIVGTPSLFSNKDFSAGENNGFLCGFRTPDDIIFNFGDGSNCKDIGMAYPSNYRRGWVHIVLVMDREAGKVNISTDFDEFREFEIPTELKDDFANALPVLNIGQDGTGNYSNRLNATVDEFILFDGALTQDDVTALASYYGVAANN